MTSASTWRGDLLLAVVRVDAVTSELTPSVVVIRSCSQMECALESQILKLLNQGFSFGLRLTKNVKLVL